MKSIGTLLALLVCNSTAIDLYVNNIGKISPTIGEWYYHVLFGLFLACTSIYGVWRAMR